MRTPRTLLGALLLAGALAAPVAAHAAEDDPEGPREVADATFAWSVSDQTNARSHNPAAINFLAAGIADPGRGGVLLPQSKWRARAGDVEVQKRAASGAWQRATWAGLETDAHGATIDINGPFSGHRVLLVDGAGTLDPATDTAHLVWSGTFSVVYYGGNSVFTVTDPVLDLADGAGAVTASLGGWAADRADPTKWTPLPPQRVTIADLSGVDLTEDGATATPAYAGVAVEGTVAQTRTGPGWGSFPASMVAYLGPLAVDQFWYSTGLASDATKVPLPITVGYGGRSPEAKPTPQPTAKPTAKPTNQVLPGPAGPPSSTPEAAPPAAPAPAPVPAPVVLPPAPAPAPVVSLQPVSLTASEATAVTAPATAPTRVATGWWAGGALLLAAALLLLVPARRRTNS